MLLDRADAALAAAPTAVLLLGDLNEAAPASVPKVPLGGTHHTSAAYEALVHGGFVDLVDLSATQPFGPASSFVGFYHDAPPGGGRVDHVLGRVRDRVAVNVTLAGIVPIDDERGALPSDHRPVLVDTVFYRLGT